ncbi:MAG: alanyl-tRNA editing protein [Myxococcota bacterium]
MDTLQACQRDATLRHGRFTVLRTAVDGEAHLAWLDDTVLYAEGGGQPSDRGVIRSEAGEVRVREVRATEDGWLHVLEGPVPVGEVEVAVDWGRRFDHMQQHSAQHLLSALAHDRRGWATTSFHLHEGLGAVCDVELDAAEIGPEALHALQDEVNAEIRAARPVVPRLVDALPEGVRSRGLPEGHRGPIRLVEIAGLDLNTCGGTHVASTAELQAVALLGTERIRGGTRVRYVAGERVLARLVAAEAQRAELGALLSRGGDELGAGVRAALDAATAPAKARAAAEAELADALGAALAAGQGVRALHRPTGDAALLNRIAGAVLRAAPDAVVWLTAGEGEAGAFLLAGPPAVVAAHKEAVLALMEARGGGAAGRLQGRAARLSARDAVLAVLTA